MNRLIENKLTVDDLFLEVGQGGIGAGSLGFSK